MQDDSTNVAEVWMPVPEFPGYEVSNHGRVRTYFARSKSLKTVIGEKPRIMNHSYGRRGYHRVTLRCDGKQSTKSVHSLVLTAFVGPRPVGGVCCHGNGDVNDNRVSNLRWGTHMDNERDKEIHGTQPRGMKHGNAKLTDDQVRKIREMARNGMTGKDIAVFFNISADNATYIIRRAGWKHV